MRRLNAKRRAGVSLLEVLFAMGAIAIGLLGVIAIFPLALSQVGHGVIVDRARQAGVNAVERFTAHGMNRPDQAVMYDSKLSGSPLKAEIVAVNPVVDTLVSGRPVMLLPDGPNSSYVIDPQFVAANGGNTAAPGFDARLFPYYSRSAFFTGGSPPPYWEDPRMRRVTLGAHRDWNSGWSSLNRVQKARRVMSAAHAAAVFGDLDELVFNTPEEANLSPVQEFGANASPLRTSGASGAKRQYEGRISWMATLTPQLDITDSGAAPSDLYILSIVVFNSRDSSFTMNNTNERLADVASFDNGGLGGGDVNLVAVTNPQLGVDPIARLELKRGNWVLLMSTVHFNDSALPTTSTPVVSLFRWYRVVETEEEPRVTNTSPLTAERYVTLEGPDWPVEYLSARPSVSKPLRPTRAVLMDNIIAVYERTVRLETSGLWSY